MNRYETGLARLAVHGLGPRAREAFASATDLGTGLETPMRLRRDIDAGTVELWHPDCAPRTLLRVYWPLHD